MMRSEKELMENLEQILSTLRHELGNSVNSLKITLDVARQNYETFDDQKRKEYLNRGSELLTRQQRLVEAMKSYSQFRVNEQKEISFPSFWKHFLGWTSRRALDEDIKIIYEDEIGPWLIMGDTGALHKAMTSIVSNAMEAVKGTDSPTIYLRTSRTNHSLKIVIQDNGCGISESDLPRVFTPLFSTKKGKMGMGLPIARKLLIEMGGRIRIHSVFGRGTRATVWLKGVDKQARE